jgi:hypothetical protein
VKQAVIGAGRAGIDIFFFNQNAFDTPKRQISGNPGAGGAAADDQYLCL